MDLRSKRNQPLRTLLGIQFALIVFISAESYALPTTVVSNFNQPSDGSVLTVDPISWYAVPFTTDTTFTEFIGVQTIATTLYGSGLFFLEIWDDAGGQPGNVVQVLSGPAAPVAANGTAEYVARFSLQPSNTYYVVFGTRNFGSVTQVPAKSTNLADSPPPSIYSLGSNRCIGSKDSLGVLSWDCASPFTTTLYPKFRIVAEEPSPPVSRSLTANPLSVNFGSTPIGGTSGAVPVSIINDGNVDQTLGTLAISTRFNLASNACDGVTLVPAASCSVSLSFSPDHGGSTSGTLTIPVNTDPRSPYGLSLIGQSDPTYTVGGILSGLASGESLVAQNNGTDDLTLSSDGAFSFPLALTSGSSYSVTVLTNPASETCAVTNGAGTISSSDINNVSIVCALNSYTVGGNVSGLASGQTVALQNNGGDDLFLSSDGAFVFAAPLADSTNYSVTISAQPMGQTCTVSNGSGSLAGADVSNVAVDCVDDPTPPSVTPTAVPVMPLWLLALMATALAGIASVRIRGK